MDFTNQYHLDSYPSLSPTRPELSQSGCTVLITGGAGGIGLAISRSFAKAGAARLILVARRAANLAEAKEELEKLSGTNLAVVTYSCDVGDAAGVRHVWDDLEAKGIPVDVLVLNAAVASTTPEGLAEDDLVSKVWSTFEINVRSSLQMTDIFLKQGPKTGKVSGFGGSPARIPLLPFTPLAGNFQEIVALTGTCELK